MNQLLTWILVGEIALLVVLVIMLVMTIKGGKPRPSGAVRAPQPAVNRSHPSVDPVIVQGITRYASRFTGLYEALYMAAQSDDAAVPDAYQEWHVRMMKLQNDTAFYGAFRARFPEAGVHVAQMRSLLAHIHAAGVHRCGAATHVADAETKNRYIYLGSEPVCLGREYAVAKPCWLLGEITVEQGVLMPEKE